MPMKLLPALGLIAALAAPAAAQRSPLRLTGANAKQTVPVEILVTAAPTDAQRLHLVARPRVDAKTLSVAVAVEDGLQLVSAPEWSVAASAGVESTRDLEVRITGPGEQRVVVTTTLTYDDGSAESGVEVFVLNPPGPVRGFARVADPSVVHGPGGRTVVEVMTGAP
jgi:hypothetical protein